MALAAAPNAVPLSSATPPPRAGGRPGRPRRAAGRHVRERVERPARGAAGHARERGEARRRRVRAGARNSASIAATASCGPVSAATPARCTNGGTHEVEFTKKRVNTSTSGRARRRSRSASRSSRRSSRSRRGRSCARASRACSRSTRTRPRTAAARRPRRRAPRPASPQHARRRPRGRAVEHAAGRVLRRVEDHELRAVGQARARARRPRSAKSPCSRRTAAPGAAPAKRIADS